MSRLAALHATPQPWAPDLNPGGDVRSRHDAQLALREIRVLQGDVDLAVAPHLAEAAEPLVAQYQGRPTVGDHLRLPRMTNHDATTMRSSVRRFLAADTSTPGGSREDVVKEAKLRRVFVALDLASQAISRRAAEESAR